ncbi:MAG: phosphatidylglycerol lysyltransferase domain-containing protein, partial [Acidobacteria bacterium]|nr:phosphatidylglycerol lysyltransferase domain-containing protein [Acidobacteriota bacterium]
PYSDFNFTSLWCWNVSEKIQVSQLYGNLIVRFTDYVTGEPFYSFCGNCAADKTASALIDLARTEGLPSVLTLVPSETAAALSNKFCITEDPDNFDYILSLAEMNSFHGNRFGDKRNLINRFLRRNTEITTCLLDLKLASTQQQIEMLLKHWAFRKQMSAWETKKEFTAIRRLLDSNFVGSLIGLGVFCQQQLVGFSITEVLCKTYAMAHFEKGDIHHAGIGIYAFVMQQTALYLAEAGCRHLNYQQDLGIKSLRHAKDSYNPYMLLKKFQVTMTKPNNR